MKKTKYQRKSPGQVQENKQLNTEGGTAFHESHPDPGDEARDKKMLWPERESATEKNRKSWESGHSGIETP